MSKYAELIKLKKPDVLVALFLFVGAGVCASTALAEDAPEKNGEVLGCKVSWHALRACFNQWFVWAESHDAEPSSVTFDKLPLTPYPVAFKLPEKLYDFSTELVEEQASPWENVLLTGRTDFPIDENELLSLGWDGLAPVGAPHIQFSYENVW